MKTIKIYEPAMCCPTGLCGVGVDKELLRISAVFSRLEKMDVKVDRFNLSTTPAEFVKSKEINDLLIEAGIDVLPVTIVDGEIVKKAEYPSNKELSELLDIPEYVLDSAVTPENEVSSCCGEEDSSDESCC